MVTDGPTRLEQEQARRIDYLELELHKEQERYRTLMERIAFPPEHPIQQVPSGPFQSVAQNKLQAEAHRLSQLSRQRLQDQIDAMEKRAATISARDESLSAKANNEEKEETEDA